MGDLRPRAAGGFTIVELMVVMLIMLLLLVVLAPSVQKIHRTVMRVTALSTIRLIDGGCKMYYEDFGEYPVSKDDTNYSGWYGKELLVLFMTGYGPDPNSDGMPETNLYTDDGREGLGFRTEKAGYVFGPYNGTEGIKTTSGAHGPVFVDAFDEEIYYYRFDSNQNGYNNDNDADGPIEVHGTDYAENNYAAPAYYFRRDFILVTAGPDGEFEDIDDTVARDTDDITNFLEEQH